MRAAVVSASFRSDGDRLCLVFIRNLSPWPKSVAVIQVLHVCVLTGDPCYRCSRCLVLNSTFFYNNTAVHRRRGTFCLLECRTFARGPKCGGNLTATKFFQLSLSETKTNLSPSLENLMDSFFDDLEIAYR